MSRELFAAILRSAMHGLVYRDYYRAPRGRLTTRYHDYIIGDNSDEGQDASLWTEMGNPNSYSVKEELNYGKRGYHYA